MKRYLIISVIFLSVLLASCSQTDNSLSPVSPVLDKPAASSQIMPVPFPFPLYTTFKSFTIKQWMPSEKAGVITLEIANDMPKGCIVFAVITYKISGWVKSPAVDKEMVFLDHQYGKKIDVPVTEGKDVSKITIYGGVENPRIDVNYYKYGQRFKFFAVQDWKFANDGIVLAANENMMSATNIYTEISYKGAGELVFMQKPSSNVFSVPSSNSIGITGLSLFGIPVNLPMISTNKF